MIPVVLAYLEHDDACGVPVLTCARCRRPMLTTCRHCYPLPSKHAGRKRREETKIDPWEVRQLRLQRAGHRPSITYRVLTLLRERGRLHADEAVRDLLLPRGIVSSSLSLLDGEGLASRVDTATYVAL